MKEKIVEILHEIEQRENVKIVYACESGSRAWGFASENSDYDVRFIYGRHWKDRFTINQYRTVIDNNKGNIETSEFIRNLEGDELDFSGWDIVKTMSLLAKGNPALAEWLQSPIVYMADGLIYPWLRRLSTEYFESKAGIFHYTNMASRNFTQYIENQKDTVILKKYLYVLRPVYACAWCILKDSPPPMSFKDIYTDKEINSYLYRGFQVNMREHTEWLIDMKQRGDELGRAPKVEALDNALRHWLNFFRVYSSGIDIDEISEKVREEIDSNFVSIVSHISHDLTMRKIQPEGTKYFPADIINLVQEDMTRKTGKFPSIDKLKIECLDNGMTIDLL